MRRRRDRSEHEEDVRERKGIKREEGGVPEVVTSNSMPFSLRDWMIRPSECVWLSCECFSASMLKPCEEAAHSM